MTKKKQIKKTHFFNKFKNILLISFIIFIVTLIISIERDINDLTKECEEGSKKACKELYNSGLLKTRMMPSNF